MGFVIFSKLLKNNLLGTLFIVKWHVNFDSKLRNKKCFEKYLTTDVFIYTYVNTIYV